MRSLPDRFESKVTAIEENSGYMDMKPSEVIGRLLAYESRKAPSTTTPPKKSKGIALKASKDAKEAKHESDEDLALFVKRERNESRGKLTLSEVESDSSSISIKKFVEQKVLAKYHAEFNDLAIKSTRKIERLREENLELSAHNDHLSEQVERLKRREDKLIEELYLSKRSEEGLKRELVEVKWSLARIDSSTKKLDHLLGVGKSPSDKRGLGFEDDMETSTSKKTIFVKSLGSKEASLVQAPRKKLEVGQCSNAQVKMGPRRQPQAQPPRVPQAQPSKVLQRNIPQQLAHKGKRPIMQPQAWKQPRPVQQRRWIEPTYPQRHG
ncbi:hypothetical protein LWI29_028860 [Acer saccharum]|uniref:Uncharacterized protein n=1 Tax=Acer saccharum TaxID=4024 RepID=A0AA39SIL1_ACESA|nr:hypothetical protein LWI29_028860 [Acer saccharum]